MELKESLSRLASRIPQQLHLLQTEEATKNALVMPLLSALGYNVFDPTEVLPEFTADVGIKKGEKVDYAIMIDGAPMILIECKSVGSRLDRKTASQLYRYFSTTPAKFGVLTDGVHYQLFSDLDEPNKMDEAPFFEFRMTELDGATITELQKFTKGSFDLQRILDGAGDLKYRKQLQRVIAKEFASPSDELVRLLCGQIYTGRFTAEVKAQFQELVSAAFKELVRSRVNSRLESALSSEVVEPTGDDEGEASEIETTEDELQGFHIVRAICSSVVPAARIVMRDTKSYCGILLDDNNRKPICRLRFNRSTKYVGVFDAQKAEIRHEISGPEGLYAFQEQFLAAIARYDGGGDPDPSPDQGGE